MTTFISYQPRRRVPAFRSDDICASGPVGSADCAPWPQSRRARERSKLDVGADFLGRLGSAQPREATPESSTIPETPQVPEVDLIEECDEGAIDADGNDSGDRGHCSDDSELPSLEELLSQAREVSGTSDVLDLKSTATSEQLEPIDRRNSCSGTGSETRASPGVDAARGMFSKGNQDNPIVLDESEDEHDSQRGVIAPDNDDPNHDTASSVDCHDSPPLPIVPSFTDGAHGTRNSTGDHTLQNGENEEGRKKHENNRSSHESGCANEEPAGGSKGQETSASAGNIHDIFADYERRFSMKKPNQQAQKQRTTRYPSTRDDCDQTVVSSSSVRQSVCGDSSQTASTGDAGIEEYARMVDDDLGLSRSPEASTAGESTFQSRQDSEQQLPRHDVEFDSITHAIVSQESSVTDNVPLNPHAITDNTIRSGTGLASRNLSTRKRPRQSSESIPALPGDLASKRPRRVTRESWKAREARELSEAKQAVASSRFRSRPRPCAPKRVAQARLTCDGNGRNSQIADVEDVYLAEDGSVQCVVRWKASLVARENLVNESLRRRCEGLFEKKYGAQWW